MDMQRKREVLPVWKQLEAHGYKFLVNYADCERFERALRTRAPASFFLHNFDTLNPVV